MRDSTIGMRPTLPIALLGVLFVVPFDAKAQMVGTANPTGGATLSGPDGTPSTGEGGNPMQFDSTIQFGGLTATGDATNTYVFQSNYVNVAAVETLSLTRSVGANGGQAFLETTANISGQQLGPPPPGNSDFLWYWLGSTVNVTGMLAPGDRAFFLLDAIVGSAGNPVYDINTRLQADFSYSETFTNTGDAMMPISFFAQYPGGYCGDWYYLEDFGNFPAVITLDLQEYILKTTSSSSDESWISLDPSLGIMATSPQSIPEPGSLVLAVTAACGMIAYGLYRRRRIGGCIGLIR